MTTTTTQPVATTASATTTPSTTTTAPTSVQRTVLTARPGEQIEVDLGVVRSGDGSTRRVAVWLSKPTGPPETFMAGVAGYADVGTTERVTARLTIPHMMSVRARFRPVELIATPIDTYSITLSIYDTAGNIAVAVTQEGQRWTAQPTLSRGVVPESSRLLGEDGIGAVKFGSAENDALRALVDLFGTPDGDTGWREGCVDNRSVAWGGLAVWFRSNQYAGDRRFTDGYFAAYTYTRVDNRNLASTDGVLLGDSLDDLRASIPSVRFKTAYEGLDVGQFFVGSEMNSGLEGDLSTDATDPAARVAALVSGLPLHHPHNVC